MAAIYCRVGMIWSNFKQWGCIWTKKKVGIYNYLEILGGLTSLILSSEDIHIGTLQKLQLRLEVTSAQKNGWVWY